MATPQPFEKEKLIISVIYHDTEIFSAAKKMMIQSFGEFDLVSEPFSFAEYSSYYDAELGGEGTRQIFSFKTLVDPSRQADIKLRTNEIEDIFSRKINLDPGFINDARLLLPTTKKLGFRTPLKDGIYSDLTLFYSRGKYHKLPWTYRDYQSELVLDFLLSVRKKYIIERRRSLKEK
jgi:hypothetical protein